MPRDGQRAREKILDATDRLLRRGGAATVDQVAAEAGCAKGLVHYHFHTKGGLLAATAARLSGRRIGRWTEAFRAPTPEAAISRSWDVLASEARDGTIRAWTALSAEPDGETGRTVSSEGEAFGRAIAGAAERLLNELGLVPTVATEEIGLLLAAVVHGTGLQLTTGVPVARLQGAYSAAWLGLLSLTRAS